MGGSYYRRVWLHVVVTLLFVLVSTAIYLRYSCSCIHILKQTYILSDKPSISASCGTGGLCSVLGSMSDCCITSSARRVCSRRYQPFGRNISGETSILQTGEKFRPCLSICWQLEIHSDVELYVYFIMLVASSVGWPRGSRSFQRGQWCRTRTCGGCNSSSRTTRRRQNKMPYHSE